MQLRELFDASLGFFPVQALGVLLFLSNALVKLNDGNTFLLLAIFLRLRSFLAVAVELAVGGRNRHKNRIEEIECLAS